MKKKIVPIKKVESVFLDSGAFNQWTKARVYARKKHKGRWSYFHTDEFRHYMDEYADFVKEWKIAIDVCANLDVIGNPEITWENQQYLESRGIKPVPVVHYGTDLKWLQHYLDKGYKYIGLGGLVGNDKNRACLDWVDSCFHIICDKRTKLPKIKLHGFGVSSPLMFRRYPWYSTDSASWDIRAGFGVIMVPKIKKGKWNYDSIHSLKVSEESKKDIRVGSHFFALRKGEQQIVKDWLKFIKVPLGKMKGDKIIRNGVTTHHVYRRVANCLFMDHFVKSLPPWPFPFQVKKKSRGLF